MILWALLTLSQAAAPVEPVATPEQIASTFERFCLKTGADRDRFDAEIARAPEVRKTSSPSLFSKVELNRRWKSGSVEISFLDAPPPAGRLCGVTSSARGGFDGRAIIKRISNFSDFANLALVDGDPDDVARWSATSHDGSTLIVNNRPNPLGFGDVEILLRPASD